MYRTKGGQLRRVLGAETPLYEIDAPAVDRFIATRLAETASRNTVHKELVTLRAALKLAKRRGEYLGDIAAIMPVRWSTDYEPRATVVRTADDLQAIIDQLLPERGAWVAFVVATGARRSEADRARRSDVDLEGGYVRIRGKKTKQADKVIPIVSFMRPLLEHALAHGLAADVLFPPWGNVGRELPDACERAGLERLSPNDLRRTTATWLRVQGIEPSLLAGVMRHADARMVERVYGRLAPDALRAQLQARLGERDVPQCAAPSACLPLPEVPAGELLHCDTGVPEKSGFGALGGLGRLPKSLISVPRDGIEPPTRGFSIRPTKRESTRKQAKTVLLRRVV